MAQVGIFVTLVARDRQWNTLVAHLQGAAQATMDQPGTLLWTVQVSPTDPQTVSLYEVYADEAAHQAHETAPGYAVGMRRRRRCWPPRRS